MTTSSGYTAFQDNAFQRNAFQIFTNVGYADTSIVEIKNRRANVTVDETPLKLANVSIVEIST